MKMELLRLRFDEQVRSEKRKSARHRHRERRRPAASSPGARSSRPHTRRGQRPLPAGRVRRRPLAGAPGRGHRRVPRPGRVLPPHLPHREPEAAARRRACGASSGKGGDPVVQLQTNFGGGKTHSMLALYHLFSGIAPQRAARHRRGAAGGGRRRRCPRCSRVVLVGNKISPGNPVTKPDGTVVRTLWGELAWQLGGKKAFARIAGRRREGHQPRRRAARAVQRVRPVPDPDRRVGGLRPPAPRPERPARPAASRRSSPSPRR